METCYMCEKAYTSKEHVPPKCIFPEQKDLPKGYDFRKKLITVPSCDRHNSHKSKDDEYLMFILSTPAQGNKHSYNHFASKVMRAYSRKPHVFDSFMKNVIPVVLKDNNKNFAKTSISYEVDIKRFNRIFHSIACGVYYSHYNKKWLGKSRVFSNILMDLDSESSLKINNSNQSFSKKISQEFTNERSIGENEKIFYYKLITDKKDQHCIHMVFYEQMEITVCLLENV